MTEGLLCGRHYTCLLYPLALSNLPCHFRYNLSVMIGSLWIKLFLKKTNENTKMRLLQRVGLKIPNHIVPPKVPFDFFFFTGQHCLSLASVHTAAIIPVPGQPPVDLVWLRNEVLRAELLVACLTSGWVPLPRRHPNGRRRSQSVLLICRRFLRGP